MLSSLLTSVMRVCRGEPWHRLRQEDFTQVELEGSPELFALIKEMMRMDPAKRVTAHEIWLHPIVTRAREAMERMLDDARENGTNPFVASPLAGVSSTFLEEILARKVDARLPSRIQAGGDHAMDLSP